MSSKHLYKDIWLLFLSLLKRPGIALGFYKALSVSLNAQLCAAFVAAYEPYFRPGDSRQETCQIYAMDAYQFLVDLVVTLLSGASTPI